MTQLSADEKLNRLHVLVTKRQYDWITKRSFKTGQSMGMFMRQLIAAAMEKGGEK